MAEKTREVARLGGTRRRHQSDQSAAEQGKAHEPHREWCRCVQDECGTAQHHHSRHAPGRSHSQLKRPPSTHGVGHERRLTHFCRVKKRVEYADCESANIHLQEIDTVTEPAAGTVERKCIDTR